MIKTYKGWGTLKPILAFWTAKDIIQANKLTFYRQYLLYRLNGTANNTLLYSRILTQSHLLHHHDGLDISPIHQGGFGCDQGEKV